MAFENNFFPLKENKTSRAAQKQLKRSNNGLKIK